MKTSHLFAHDDYEEIQEKYFAEMRATHLVHADPSGWLQTYSEAEPLVKMPHLCARDVAHYYIDEGMALGRHKEDICSLVSAWEERPVSLTELTLCPSGACASLITLSALKSLGIRRVLFETPAYFGTIEQAKEIGLRFELLPTYRSDGYALPIPKAKQLCISESAVWLTQPRASLGFNQPLELIEMLLKQVGRQGVVVVDEATDQSFPAHLSPIQRAQPEARIIRLRSFTKGMGLNGFRLACVIHPSNLRGSLVGSLEALGGSIDAHSLFAVCLLGTDIGRLRAMLSAANRQVNVLRTTAERLARGTPLAVNPLVNGYIGSMVADLGKLGRTQQERRHALLEGCRKTRTPVILGSSMYMAKAAPTEAIRLNFFSLPEHITRGITNLLTIWNGL